MPATLGRYTIVRELGTGGIGRVVEGLDPRTGRRVAIKTLLADHTSAAAQRSLLDEAAAVVQLSHPNVVELIDVGRDESGAAFLVMELVDGTTMRAWRTRWPGASVALRGFDEVLDALSAAHAQGIVHGDLKPANVLVDRNGRVKVADFGIARVLDPLRRRDDATVAGTPHYMAPEQLFDPDDIGPSTDLFAVGVMLRDLFFEPVQSADEPLVARSRMVVPPELLEVVARLLDPNPRRRTRFAALVRRDLASIARLAGDAGPAPRDLEDQRTRVEASRPPSSPAQALSDSVAGAGATPPEVVVRRLRPVPLVGRDAELAELAELAERSAEGDGPHALVIVGRAGEGKSRLARHGFAAAERAGTMVGAAASFDEAGGSANVDLRDCLRRLIGAPRPGSTLAETLEHKWAWIAPWLAEADARGLHRWLLPNADPVDADAGAMLAARALAAASRARPIYLWLDDVGWSRDGATELVLRLLEGNARIFVVATMRSGTADHPRVREWLDRVAAHPRATIRKLAPLRHAERAELLHVVGRIAPEPASALARLLDSPTLVIVEAVRDWIDEGLLVEVRDGFAPREGLSLAELAGRARDVVARRVGALLSSFGEAADVVERLMIHAALLGVQLEERALRACVEGSGDAAMIDAVLDRALLVGVLRVQAAGVYRFDHQLFAESLLERAQRRADRPELMVRTAGALVRVYSTLRAEPVVQAACLYRAGGARVEAYRQAFHVVTLFSSGDAFDQVEAIIDLVSRWAAADGDGPEGLGAAWVHRAKGIGSYYSLDYPSALDSMRVARELFRRNGDTDLEARTAIDESSVLFYSDRFREMTALLDEIVSMTKDPVVLGLLEHRYAELCSLRCDIDRAIEHQRRAVDVSAAEIPHHRGFFIATLSDLLLVRGEIAEGERLRRRVAEILTGSSRPDTLHLISALACLSLTVRGYHAEALVKLRPWTVALRSAGNRWLLTSALGLLAACQAAIGDQAEAEKAVNELMLAYREVPHDEMQTWWAIRVTESWLRGHGLDALAAELGAMLDARQHAIAAAFER
jgi:hypothetical protein